MSQILDCPPSERKQSAVVDRLAADIAELSARFNRRATSFVVPCEYLEVVIER